MLTFSIILNVVLVALLAIAAYALLRFIKYSFQYEDCINECLDSLDKSYMTVAELLNKPLLIDTPEVRQIMAQLQNAQDTILVVANQISLKSADK